MPKKIDENKLAAKPSPRRVSKKKEELGLNVDAPKAKRPYVRKTKKVGLVVRNIASSKESIDTIKATKDKEKLLIAKDEMKIQAKAKKEKPVEKAQVENVKKEEPRARVIKERREEDRHFIMWVGVSFFMILVIIFWFFSTKETIERSKSELRSSGNAIEWNDLADQLSKQIGDIKNGVATVKDFASSSQEQVGTTSSSALFRAGGGETSPLDSDLIDDLKEELEAKLPTQKTKNDLPYFAMADDEKAAWLEKLASIKEGDSLQKVRGILGEASYSEELRDKKGSFVSTVLDYIISQEEDELDVSRDSFVRLIFDSAGDLERIEKVLK